LSCLELGEKARAREIFNALRGEGRKRMEQGSEIDFFAKFGEREAANVRFSNARLLVGLGSKGLGETEKALDNLREAVDLSASNLWAAVELGEN